MRTTQRYGGLPTAQVKEVFASARQRQPFRRTSDASAPCRNVAIVRRRTTARLSAQHAAACIHRHTRNAGHCRQRDHRGLRREKTACCRHGGDRFTPRRAQGVWCKGGRTPVSPSLYLAFSIKNLCERCDAVCCRLTVMVDPSDRIPNHLTSVTPQGWHVMARDEEGWCVAIDAARMCCSIYETRPAICRRFVMSGPYCRDVRATYDDQRRRGIPLTLYNA